MGRFLEGDDRNQSFLLPAHVDDYVPQEALVRVVDAFVGALDLTALGFERTISAATGRPGYYPGDMLRLYIWGYLNQLRSSRQLERACNRDRLNIADKHAEHGGDQAANRVAFAAAIASLQRRKQRLERRQAELADHDTNVVVFGEPDARPMGYGRAPKFPAYNLQSVVDVGSGLIIHNDVANEANDSQLLHPMAIAAMEVLEVDELEVLADGGYSNAQEVARCEQDGVRVAAPIKRGAMSAQYFRPVQFVHDEETDTIRCPAGETLHPKGRHTRNRAIHYRTPACQTCQIKQHCTPGYQRTIHRLVDQGALDRMERRVHENPDLMTIRRCTVEHPFGTIKRMSGGGRFLTRGLRHVKAEAALSVLAFNIIRASNAFGSEALVSRG